MYEKSKLRMINRARVDAIFPIGKKWHYPASLSILCVEERDEKETLLSHLISYSYLPTLNQRQRAELRLKIYELNKNIEKADEDEMLEMLKELKKMSQSIEPADGIDELFWEVPMGICLDGDSRKLAIYPEYPPYLAGPAPVFEYLLNNIDYNIATYELRALLESKPEYIMMAYAAQEKTLKDLLGEAHYIHLFPYLLLANRRGRYIWKDRNGDLKTTNFKTQPTIILEEEKTISINVNEILASKPHMRWFIKSFIEENMLQEALYTLEEFFKPIKLNNFSVVVFEDGVGLGYIETLGVIHLLTSDGLYRL